MDEECHKEVCRRHFGSDEESVYKPLMKKNFIGVQDQPGRYK
jgi:hypothetical protein